jgi:putative transcriptional regulator
LSEDAYRESAAAYALGALDPGERAAFEAHLEAGCASCADEVDAHHDALLALAQAGPTPALHPAIRQQALDLRLAPTVPVEVGAYAWEEVVPGVRLHVLREEPARGLRACLVWAEPGARTPRHRHHGDEVILLLKGGLRDDRGTYGPGQICRSRAGSVHAEEALPGEDCVCLVLYYGPLEVLEEADA